MALIGATHFRNLWLTTGHGAPGFPLALGSAQWLADLLAERELPIDGDAFAPGR
jgi:D-amino-acid dehydrogenase